MENNEFLKLRKVSPERIWRHHRMLCREIGHRLAGTENDKRAAEYIEAHFSSCGLKTGSQTFNCPSWDHRSTSIYTGSGHRITSPEGGACTFSISCDVTGEIINVKTLDELKNAYLKGKICVISGDLRHAPIRLNRNPILLLIEEKAPLAVIVIDIIEHGYQTKVIRDPEFKVPVCAVSANSGTRLLEEGGMVTVKIEANRFAGSSRNIFALNTERNVKKICVMAHYDTASDTPGALDNGSGISIILEVAEALKETGLDIPVEFIAFGGEEYETMLGSTQYLKDFPDRIDSTSLAINIDGVGYCNSLPQIFLSREHEKLSTTVCRLAEIVGGYHEIILDHMLMGSDHEVFFKRGVPTILFNDKPATLVWDTNVDIPRFICLERMEDVARIILGLINESASMFSPKGC